jgi:hypothetical protein
MSELFEVEETLIQLGVGFKSQMTDLNLQTEQRNLVRLNLPIPKDRPPVRIKDEDKKRMLEKSILRSDKGIAWLAFVLALLTGMNEFYFGKTFGTLQDYLTLFLWAAGTKVALDFLNALLDRFFSRRVGGTSGIS